LSKPITNLFINKLKEVYSNIYTCKVKVREGMHTVILGPVSDMSILSSARKFVDKDSFVRTLSSSYLKKSCIKH